MNIEQWLIIFNYCSTYWGMSPWWLLPKLLSWYPIFKLSHCNSFEDQAPYDITLQWHHNERNGISNQQHIDCLFNHLFRHRSKKTLKFRITGLCEGNSPVTGEFPTQKASNTDNIFIWWRHHDLWVRDVKTESGSDLARMRKCQDIMATRWTEAPFTNMG